MSQRWWYLRRAVPWTALLGCCAAAVLVSLLLGRWPAAALVLLPALVACCAGAAAFSFDEVTLAVVEVTPRGSSWRQVARLAVTVVPLTVWCVVVALAPGDLTLDRWSWWAVGGAAIALAVGLAALASRLSVPTPGAVLAPVLVLGLIGVVLVGMFLGLEPVYPFNGPTGSTRGFWSAVAAGGALAVAAALRPGVHR